MPSKAWVYKGVECTACGMRPGDLIRLMIEDEAHALIIGRPGAGKTSLIRLALAERRDVPALVFDYVGNYGAMKPGEYGMAYVDYYGVYPINPLDYVKPQDFIDALAKVILVAYGYANAMSPAMEEVLLTAFEESVVIDEDGEEHYSIPHALQWLYTEGPNYFKNADELAALRGARRRLNELANNVLFARTTHPILDAWLKGELKAQVGVRLRGFSLRQVLLYVTSLLTIMARREVESSVWRLVVVDEAQYFAGIEGISPLEEAVRIGRNYGYLFIAITQNPQAIPQRLMDVFKVIVNFRKSFHPRKAAVETYITNPDLMGLVKFTKADEEPVYRDMVEVDIKAMVNSRRRAVEWFDCLRRAGLEPSITKRYIYYKACAARNPKGCVKWEDRVKDLSDFPSLWNCLAGRQLSQRVNQQATQP